MYAVLKSGGKQYKVEEGQVLRLEKLAGDVGSAIKFDQVLLTSQFWTMCLWMLILSNREKRQRFSYLNISGASAIDANMAIVSSIRPYRLIT